MNMPWLRLGLPGLLLLASTTSVQAAALIYSFSNACANGFYPECTSDYRYGNPATSSVIRGESYIPPGGGGYNYAAEAAATGVPAGFGLYARAGGGTFAPNFAGGPGQFGMSASAQIQYHDEVNVPGSGFGTILVPWHITGGFGIPATSGAPYAPGANFGVSFCQSIKTGNSSGGLGCTGGGTQSFTSSTTYDMTLLLQYFIEFGVDYSLNTTFALGVGSGAGLAVAAVADFFHTGLQQPASVYDSNGNLMPDALIVSASGVDYRNPQAVPVPASLVLLGSGILGLGWRTQAGCATRRRAPHSRRNR